MPIFSNNNKWQLFALTGALLAIAVVVVVTTTVVMKTKKATSLRASNPSSFRTSQEQQQQQQQQDDFTTSSSSASVKAATSYGESVVGTLSALAIKIITPDAPEAASAETLSIFFLGMEPMEPSCPCR